MDATMFDGTTTSPLTTAAAAGAAGRSYTWYDLDVRPPGSADQARELLTALGVDDTEQALLLKPNRSAQVQTRAGNVDAVVWVGEDADGTPPPEVHVSWTRSRLVTVRWGGGTAVQRIRDEFAARAQKLFDDPADVLAVLLLLTNASVDRRLTHLDLAISQIDDAIVQGTDRPPLSRLRALRTEVAALELRYAGLVDAASSAVVDAGALPGVDAPSAARLQEYVTHVTDTYHHVRELAEGARSALQDYQTALGDRQGDRINQLTIVSVVFLPISFLTGYFGMNFQWLDNQLMTQASWVVWGVALPLVTLLVSVLALRRLGYLSRTAPQRRGPMRGHPSRAASPSTTGRPDRPRSTRPGAR